MAIVISGHYIFAPLLMRYNYNEQNDNGPSSNKKKKKKKQKLKSDFAMRTQADNFGRLIAFQKLYNHFGWHYF